MLKERQGADYALYQYLLFITALETWNTTFTYRKRPLNDVLGDYNNNIKQKSLYFTAYPQKFIHKHKSFSYFTKICMTKSSLRTFYLPYYRYKIWQNENEV